MNRDTGEEWRNRRGEQRRGEEKDEGERRGEGKGGEERRDLGYGGFPRE